MLSFAKKALKCIAIVVVSLPKMASSDPFGEGIAEHSYTVKCGNRLRVGVRAKNAGVSGFACPTRLHSTQNQEWMTVKSEVKVQTLRTILMSKCSWAPSGVRQGFGGPNYPRHPSQVAVLHPPKSQDKCYRGVRDGVRQSPLGGCSCDTPATHSKLQKEPQRG